MRPNTKVVYVESPGSLTFEVQDMPAIAAVAHRHGAKVLMDNTWGTPYLFRSFEHGVDVSIHAATKYIVRPFRRDARRGHHQRGELFCRCARRSRRSRPLRRRRTTCSSRCAACAPCRVRLERHQRNALEVARWLQTRPEVSRVLYPALPEDPGHAMWKRDFLGASGLFGVVLKPASKEAVYAMIDALDLFGIGASWGGFESLIQPTYPERIRTATRMGSRGAAGCASISASKTRRT